MESEKQYALAFNNGYVLAEYEPTLLNSVTRNIAPANNYLRGFFAGKEQFELENVKRQLFELDQLRSNTQGKQRDFEREE